MKQITHIVSLVLMTLLCISCYKSDVDNLYDKSPEERTAQALEDIRTDLINSEMGWYTEYTFYINDGSEEEKELSSPFIVKFKDDNRVDIKSVYEGYEQKESSYQLKYAQQVDLVFDTYSVFSYLVDIVRHADFRWELDSINADKYYFTSRASQTEGVTYLTLERADAQSLQRYEEAKEEFKKNMAIQDIRRALMRDSSEPYFRNLKIESLDQGFAFEYTSSNDMMTFKGVFVGSNNVLTHGTVVTINPDGEIVLNNPFEIGGKFIRALHFDIETGKLVISDSDDWKGEVIYETQPAFTSVGLANTFMRWNYAFTNQYSDALIDLLNDVINNNIAGFQTFQFYNNFGEQSINGIMIYTDPAPDNANRWDGMENTILTKLDEDIVFFDKTNATMGFRGAQWFSEAYSDSESLRAVYDNFLCDPQGLYLDYDVTANTMMLVSKRDPKLYIRLKNE
ncbi:MAG: DUF4302 domain-containing protein [Mangrovibacterium sp.]